MCVITLCGGLARTKSSQQRERGGSLVAAIQLPGGLVRNRTASTKGSG